jgi:O-acetyl-ADP-ribose deacetylase (regulator of RNase III)
MITEGTGDLLEADVDALVNTVNCVGVMGKGIALQFKRKYPGNYEEYANACRRGEVQLGRMFVVEPHASARPRYIINFPTKQHWKSRSRIVDIEVGLQDLVQVVERLAIKSIAIPPLGAGYGGLPWVQVEPLIRDVFQAFPQVEAVLYAPANAAGNLVSDPVKRQP